ncbi:MAG TPA: diaminopropionate ammonia-lyase [Bryobacteraceae bacterium]|nr:diaminopropionate ammonia-lyase [Bryobacteraceae bacterium]
MRAFFNPFFDPEARFANADPTILQFHASLAGYRPTPLHSLSGLAHELGVGGIHVKDESRRFGLNAFKVLGASWAAHRLFEGNGRGAETLAAATDGNHGRAVAWTARRAGKRAIIYVPRHTVPARVEAIQSEGADVVIVDGTFDDAVRRVDEDSRANRWQVFSDTAYPGYMEIPAWIMDGYSTMFTEIDAQLAETRSRPPDVVMVQAGVGGLAGAAVRHFLGEQRKHGPALVSVQPTAADSLVESASRGDGEPHPTHGNQDTMMAGLACGMPSLVAWPVLKRGATLFISVEDRFAAEAMRRLYFPVLGDTRIVAGEAGAAGLAGLMALCGAAEFEEARGRLGISGSTSVLLINSEGDTDPVNFTRVTGSRTGPGASQIEKGAHDLLERFD